MKKAWTWILIVLLLAALIIGAKYLYDKMGGDQLSAQLMPEETQSQTEQTQSARQFPPDFTVYDADGNQVKLSDMRGKPVVVNFWASWCSPCKQEMPDFEAAFEKYGQDVVFMMVDMTDGQRETQENAQSHIDSNGFTFPVYFDLDMSAATLYNVVSIPATYFYDADGYLVTRGLGALNEQTLEQGIQMILS